MSRGVRWGKQPNTMNRLCAQRPRLVWHAGARMSAPHGIPQARAHALPSSCHAPRGPTQQCACALETIQSMIPRTSQHQGAPESQTSVFTFDRSRLLAAGLRLRCTRVGMCRIACHATGEAPRPRQALFRRCCRLLFPALCTCSFTNFGRIQLLLCPAVRRADSWFDTVD